MKQFTYQDVKFNYPAIKKTNKTAFKDIFEVKLKKLKKGTAGRVWDSLQLDIKAYEAEIKAKKEANIKASEKVQEDRKKLNEGFEKRREKHAPKEPVKTKSKSKSKSKKPKK